MSYLAKALAALKTVPTCEISERSEKSPATAERPPAAMGVLSHNSLLSQPGPVSIGGAGAYNAVAVAATGGYRIAAPAGDDPAAWRAWFDATTDRRAILGRRTLAEALPLAFGDLQNEWHRRHGARPVPGRCAGCGGLLGESKLMALPDGAAVHENKGWACLTAYGTRWRQAAATALRALGIEAPAGWKS